MTVTAIRLENFTAFQDTGWLELRPITLLFGRNSSGKSAIIRALRLLRQSLDQSADTNALVFRDEDGVDLGSFQLAVHQQNIQVAMIFHFRCDFTGVVTNVLDFLREKVSFHLEEQELRPIPASETPRIIDFSLAFSWDPASRKVILTGIRINCPWKVLEDRRETNLFSMDRERIIETESSDHKSWIWTSWVTWSDLLHGHEQSIKSNPWQSMRLDLSTGFLPSPTDLSGIDHQDTPVASDFTLVQGLIGEFNREINLFLRSIHYLGPFRPEPQRLYSLNQFDMQRWQKRGWGAYIEFLSNNIPDASLVNKIDEWVRHLKLGKSVQVNTHYKSDFGILSEIFIEDQHGDLDVNLIDLGYGISQALPIIVQSVLATSDTVVIIEQPELHLHPSAQLQLGDMFAALIYRHVLNSMTGQSKVEKSNIRFIIETHSEHLLLRFQTLILLAHIRENLKENPRFFVHPNDFALFFINREVGSSKSYNTPISVYGDLLSEPPGFRGFFSDDLKETADRMLSRLNAVKLLKE